MKILLDESVPQKLAYDFTKEHEIKTVRDMNWLGKRNGELMKLIAENNFDLFITVDRNLPYQQNQQSLTVPICILRGIDNTRERLKMLIRKVFLQLLIQDQTRFFEVS